MSPSIIIFPKYLFNVKVQTSPDVRRQRRPCACVIRGVISSSFRSESLVKMADALQSLCASPVFKRPRLDFSPENAVGVSPFEPSPSEEAFRDNPGLCRSANEVTSSSDTQIDINGGDSGFHESLPPTNGVDSTTNVANHEVVENFHQPENEADSSNVGIDIEGPLIFDMDGPPPDRDSEDNDPEDNSNFSDFSGLSDCSGPDTNNISVPYSVVHHLMETGKDPRDVLMEILPSDAMLPPNLSSHILWKLVLTALREPPPRTKLPNINTLVDVVSLLRTCSNIIVLTGAGVSVSCGIPDFRSRNGVYARLSQDYPDLPDPSAMFDIGYFKKDPRPFFKFAKEIYPGQFQASPSHHFIRTIEKQGKLLRNYTQNIDTLEHAAGIERVISCHGSFATASCTVCRHKVDSSEIKEDIFNQCIPYCPKCPPSLEERGIMKPDIVFFGEGLSDEFHDCMASDKDDCDLLIVIGSSLKVRPVACIPSNLPSHVPQILINREPLSHLHFDVELLGDCDVIIGELCQRLADKWKIENIQTEPLNEITSLPPQSPRPFHQVQTARVDSSVPSTSNDGSSRNSNNNLAPGAEPASQASKPSADDGEESNSCDYKGMSAIKLDDSFDGAPDLPCSNPEEPTVDDSNSQLPSQSCVPPFRDSISSKLPAHSYLFIPPNRYLFQGAEVYQDLHQALRPNVNYPSPNLPTTHTDSSSLSSDYEDYEGVATQERDASTAQSPDQSSLSTSSDQQSPTTSPRGQNSSNYQPECTYFKIPKDDST